MRNVHLYGALGVQFGKHHRFAVETVPEVFEALRVNFPGFIAAIRNGFYRIILGKSKSSGMTLREDQLVGLRIGNRAVHIAPTVAGRKRGGIGKVIAGIALVGLSAGALGMAPLMGNALWSGGATLGQMAGNMGVAMTLTGVATMIAPEQNSGDDKKSYTMSGPTSEMKEGGIVPIAYGEVITGGYMISGAVEINGPVSEAAGTIRTLVDAIGRPSGG